MYYADKTGFLLQFLESPADATLFTRPRRLSQKDLRQQGHSLSHAQSPEFPNHGARPGIAGRYFTSHVCPFRACPHCPVCGAPMSMNLRADDTFVEDEGWHEAAGNYEDFLRAHKGEHILFWKFGCRRKHSRHHQIPLLAHNLSESEGPLCLHQSFGGLLSQGNPRAGHLH